jgi:hypothetical protein
MAFRINFPSFIHQHYACIVYSCNCDNGLNPEQLKKFRFQSNLIIGCDMAHVASHSPLTSEDQVHARITPGGMWWTKWYWDRFFSEYLGFPCQYHSTMVSQYIILVYLQNTLRSKTRRPYWTLLRDTFSPLVIASSSLEYTENWNTRL